MKIFITDKSTDKHTIELDQSVVYALDDNPTIQVIDKTSINLEFSTEKPYVYTHTENGLVIGYGEHQIILQGEFEHDKPDITVTLAFPDEQVDINLRNPRFNEKKPITHDINDQTMIDIAAITNINQVLQLVDNEDEIPLFSLQKNAISSDLADTSVQTNGDATSNNERSFQQLRSLPPLITPSSTPLNNEDQSSYAVDRHAAFAVNAIREGLQNSAQATVLSDGSILMIWQVDRPDHQSPDTASQNDYEANIHAQRYDINGQALSSEFILNPVMLGHQVSPSAAGFATGGFVAVWGNTTIDDNTVTQWQGQRFNDNGVPVADSLFTITLDAADQNKEFATDPPHVVSFADNSFAVVWSSAQISDDDIMAQVQYFDSHGDAVGAPVSFTSTLGDSRQLLDARVHEGNLQLTWHAFNSSGDSLGISGVSYDLAGQIISNDFTVNTSGLTKSGYDVHLTQLDDGNFLVLTQTLNRGRPSFDAFGQLYDADGQAIGESFDVTSGNSDFLAIIDGVPQAVALPDGGFFLSYTHGLISGPYQGIIGQRYSAAGETLADATPITITPGATGSPFLINQVDYMTRNTSPPQITHLADGSVLVSRVDSDGYHYAQRYDANGQLLGPRFPLLSNKFTFAGDEIMTVNDVNIAALDDGGFVVVFATSASSYARNSYNDVDLSDFGVYAQRFNAHGEQTGLGFLVNSEHNDYQGTPKAIGLADGTYIIAWESYAQDGSGTGLYAQRFDEHNAPVNSEFLLNQQQTTGDQINAQLIALDAGAFMVMWETVAPNGDATSVWAQRFDAQNQALDTNPVVISTDNTQWQENLAVSDRGAQGFIAVWQTLTTDNTYDITAQLFAATGVAIGENFTVNTDILGQQQMPSVVRLNDDSYVVAWQDNSQAGDGGDIYAQRLNALGQTIGEQFLVNSITEGHQTAPSVTAMADGGFMIVWETPVINEDNSGFYDSNVYGQRYDANGEPIAHDSNTVDTATLAITPIVDDVSDFVWLNDEEASLQIPQNLGLDAGDSFTISQETLHSIGEALQTMLDPEQDLITQLSNQVTFSATDYGSTLMVVQSSHTPGESDYADIPNIDLTAGGASAVEIIDALVENDLII